MHFKNRYIKEYQPTPYYLDGGPKQSFVFEELQPVQTLIIDDGKEFYGETTKLMEKHYVIIQWRDSSQH